MLEEPGHAAPGDDPVSRVKLLQSVLVDVHDRRSDLGAERGGAALDGQVARNRQRRERLALWTGGNNILVHPHRRSSGGAHL